MKKIKNVFLIIVCILTLLPILHFNLEPNYASPIDNRMLTDWILEEGEDFTDMVDAYFKDRIGFRTEAIDTYTKLHDVVYGMMLHPSYTYGKDGYVFAQMGYESPEPSFFDLFCAYLRQVQDYCEERGVPFLYCLNPSKTTVYQEYLPRGYQYLDKVNQSLYEKLEKYGVHYITNEYLLIEKSKTEQVYNKQYDAGHWNDLGAFYGTNHILEKVAESFPEVKPRELSEFEINEVLETSLPVSHFEIEDTVPYFMDLNQENIEDITEAYKAVKRDENYNAMACLVNRAQGAEKLPRVLMFQGSYYNSRLQFLESAFQEYDAIHNYENFLDFDYYFNIFQPDCVILETAEYATNGAYFSYWGLETKKLNPKLDLETKKEQLISLSDTTYSLKEEGSLVTIIVDPDEGDTQGWLVIGEKQFDFKILEEEKKAECTIDKKYFEEEKTKIFFQ